MGEFLNKLGPALASALIVTLLSGITIGAVALRDLVVVTNNDLAHVIADVERLRQELEDFRRPGDRFTKHDGERLAHDISRLADSQSNCRERISALERKVEQAEKERDKLCDRIKACDRRESWSRQP